MRTGKYSRQPPSIIAINFLGGSFFSFYAPLSAEIIILTCSPRLTLLVLATPAWEMFCAVKGGFIGSKCSTQRAALRCARRGVAGCGGERRLVAGSAEMHGISFADEAGTPREHKSAQVVHPRATPGYTVKQTLFLFNTRFSLK